MDEDAGIRFDRITRNAEDWARYFETNRYSPEVEKDRVSTAFGKIKTSAYDIIKGELEYAIENASSVGESEFSRPALKEPLMRAFLSDEMLRVTEDGVVYLDTAIAGDEADLQDGINAAREVIKTFAKSDKQMSPLQKSNFWRRIVYPSYGNEGGELTDTEGYGEMGDLWTATMQLRFMNWNGLAPYWLFLENGDSFTGGAGIPYPPHRPTNFVYKIETKLNKMMNLALLEVDSLESEAVEETMEYFVADPEHYEVYDILEEFYRDGRKYYVYITPTRQIGVALQTSYRRMYGR